MIRVAMGIQVSGKGVLECKGGEGDADTSDADRAIVRGVADDFTLPELLVGEDKGVTYTRRVVTVVVVVVVTVSSVERIGSRIGSLSERSNQISPLITHTQDTHL